MAVRSSDRSADADAAASPQAPGPKGAPVLGSALALKADILGFTLRVMETYGDVVRVTVGPPPVRQVAHFVFHPDGAQHVLAGSADKYYKGTPVYREIEDLLGSGLLTSEGEVWKRQKRMVQPLFTRTRVAGYVPMMVGHARRLVADWTEAARAGRPVDLHEDMTAVTLRVVGTAVFGAEVDHMIPVLRDTVPYLSNRALQRGLSPVKLPATWPTPGNRKAARDKAAIYGMVDDLIASRRRQRTEGEDLVNLLLDAQDPEGGQRLRDDEVRDQALIFLLAGHETTATALTFALHLLGHHPAAQERVAAEAAAVLAGGELGLEQVQALSYTTMVVKEAMRLYPSASATGRTSYVDDVIGGYRIPAGATVIVSPWATHRHPGFWDAPDTFDPERFTTEAEKARHRYAYFPFGGGPRACIGQYFSMLEAAVVTASVVQAFAITTSSDPVKLFTGITLRPGEAMPATLALR
ncbi:MAG TPA: cytochrome P450 [Actinomycetota bacterium]|nr:cytochrome P450 [Actinomycetota bacterium]